MTGPQLSLQLHLPEIAAPPLTPMDAATAGPDHDEGVVRAAAQFIALDMLTRAVDYVADQFDATQNCEPNFQTRQILIQAISKVLDGVECAEVR